MVIEYQQMEGLNPLKTGPSSRRFGFRPEDIQILCLNPLKTGPSSRLSGDGDEPKKPAVSIPSKRGLHPDRTT